MRILIIILLILLVLLQYKLWMAPGGISDIWQMRKAIVKVNTENTQMQQRNDVLSADVEDLKQGNEAIEERAREELGMVKKGEVFYQVVQ